MGTNILFWNCQGIKPKRKKLELHLKGNVIDVIAPYGTFLSIAKSTISKSQVMILSEMTIQLAIEEVAFLEKHGLVVNKEYRNDELNIITDNEALAIELELSNNQNLTLATIYCPNGNPDLTLFQTINNLSDSVMFVGDFNSKLESGPMLKNIQKQLNLIYLNNDEHSIWTDQMATLIY